MKTTSEQFRKFLDEQKKKSIDNLFSIESGDFLTIVKCKPNSSFSFDFFKWQEKHAEFSLQKITENVFAIILNK